MVYGCRHLAGLQRSVGVKGNPPWPLRNRHGDEIEWS